MGVSIAERDLLCALLEDALHLARRARQELETKGKIIPKGVVYGRRDALNAIEWFEDREDEEEPLGCTTVCSILGLDHETVRRVGLDWKIPLHEVTAEAAGGLV